MAQTMKQQAKQKRSKRKRAVIASVLALALILSGTYAYQAISEAALNETYDEINPGGRLHDDYDGQNKDIYVENFGKTPILVRVRLDEFLKIGGDIITTTNSASTVKQDDPATWTTYIPFQTDLTKNVSNGNCNLTLGGQKWFMPTFNKSNGNLNPDQPNPRHSFDSTKDTIDPVTQKPWLGTDADVGEMPQYRDVRDGSYIAGLSGDPEEATNGYWDPGSGNVEKEDYELTWNRLGGSSGTGATEKAASTTKHFPTETKYASVISMAEWKNRGIKLSDEYYWVYDEDGWAYWSLPLYPGETTGLLLNSITFNYAQEEDWYYAINAVAQFATIDNWATEFGTDDASQTAGAPTTDGEALLKRAVSDGLFPGETFTDPKSGVVWRLLARDKLGNMLLIHNASIATNYFDAANTPSYTVFHDFARLPASYWTKTTYNNWWTSNAGFLVDYDLKWEPENLPLERYSLAAWPTTLNNWGPTWTQALSTAGSAPATNFADVLFPLSISDVYEYGSKNLGGTNANPNGAETLNWTAAMWLRSPGTGGPPNIASMTAATTIAANYTYGNNQWQHRPALWVKRLPFA